MTINPNQIAALLVAAVLGNALLLRLWWRPPVAGKRVGRRLVNDLLLILFPLALFFAGWEMYWSRSENVMLAVLCYLPLQAIFAAIIFFRYNRRCGYPPGWERLLLGNFLLLLILLLLTPAVGEVYVRFFYDTTDSIGYTKVAQRWFLRHYQLNRAKFRDNIEYPAAIAPGKRRISFVGDSFTAGHGIRNVEDRFANCIRRAHPDWEIHVLAANGSETGGEINFLNLYTARGYQVDQVVLVYCLNDINDLLANWAQNLASVTNRVAARLPFYDDSYFLDLVYDRLTVARIPWVKNYFSYVREAYRGEKWEEQKQRLQALRDLVAARGGKLSVVTFPFLNALGPNYEYQFVHDELNAFWSKENVPHLDLLPVFRGFRPDQLTVNRFDAHPNELANKLAANAIDKFLVEQIRTNPPPIISSNSTGLSPRSR